MDIRSHPIASISTWDPGHQELVVAGIAVTHRGHDGKRHGVGIERPATRTAANASAPPSSGIGRDDLGPLLWTARKEPNDLFAEKFLEGVVLNRSVFGLAQAAPGPRLLVRQAGTFGLGQCLFVDRIVGALPEEALRQRVDAVLGGGAT